MSNSSGKDTGENPNLFGDLSSADVGGATLRAAREAAGFEIADLAAELRIPKSYLEALETEQYDILPGATYGFGYIRSYCKFLKIESQPFLDKFKMQMARSNVRPDYHFPDEVLEPRMSGAMISMLLVLVLLAGYIGFQIFDRFDLNPLTKTQTIVAENQASSSSDEAPIIAQTEEPVIADNAQASEEEAAPSEVVVAEVTEEPKTQSQPAQTATDTDVAVAEASDEASADASEDNVATDNTATASEEAADKASSGETDIAVVDNGAQNANTSSALATAREPADEIIISAIAPSWVEVVRENGDVVLNKLFKPGDQYVSPSDTKLYLSTGNAGGLVLTLPGMSEFNVGQTGEIVRDLPLSRDSLRSRRSALINQ